MQKKEKALNKLLDKSPSLVKSVAPRNAYDFGGSPNKMMSTTGFGTFNRSIGSLNATSTSKVDNSEKESVTERKQSMLSQPEAKAKAKKTEEKDQKLEDALEKLKAGEGAEAAKEFLDKYIDLTARHESAVKRHDDEKAEFKSNNFTNREEKEDAQGTVDTLYEAMEYAKKLKDDHYYSIM
jgi:hypothetical protein